MTGLEGTERHKPTDLNGVPFRGDRLDYQRFFAGPSLPATPINDLPLDRYQVTLEGIRQTDPDSYRLVMYSWA